jgi:hypothetical protein
VSTWKRRGSKRSMGVRQSSTLEDTNVTKVCKALKAAREESGHTFSTINELRKHLIPLIEGDLTDERLVSMIQAHEPDHDIHCELATKKSWGSVRYRGRNIGLIRIIPKK